MQKHTAHLPAYKNSPEREVTFDFDRKSRQFKADATQLGIASMTGEFFGLLPPVSQLVKTRSLEQEGVAMAFSILAKAKMTLRDASGKSFEVTQGPSSDAEFNDTFVDDCGLSVLDCIQVITFFDRCLTAIPGFLS